MKSNSPYIIALKITLLTVAFIIVVFAMYQVKTKGLGKSAQSVLGVSPSDREIKAKVLKIPANLTPAPSQDTSSKREN